MNENAAEVLPEEALKPEAVETLKGDEPTRKVTKIDVKRAQAHQERRKRLLNKGVKPENVDQAIAEEDYRALPTERKLERIVAYFSQLIQGMANDINNLAFNNSALVGAMEINNRALEKGLAKLGLTAEDKKKFLDEAEVEIRAEFEAREKKKKAEQEKKAKAAEDASMSQALKDAESRSMPSNPAPTPTQATPEGATTFGG